MREKLFKQAGTTFKYSSTYYSQIDGQTEVVNLCLEDYQYCFIEDKSKQWSQWLALSPAASSWSIPRGIPSVRMIELAPTADIECTKLVGLVNVRLGIIKTTRFSKIRMVKFIQVKFIQIVRTTPNQALRNKKEKIM
ncbi:hypothetical protein CR513_20805, partial [Mucuna pruriens]